MTETELRQNWKKIWIRIGKRFGPDSEREVPTKNAPTDWNDDRGQFIKAYCDPGETLQIVWRRGKWVKNFNKFLSRHEIDFVYYGPGYEDFNCTKEVVTEAEFGSVC